MGRRVLQGLLPMPMRRGSHSNMPDARIQASAGVDFWRHFSAAAGRGCGWCRIYRLEGGAWGVMIDLRSWQHTSPYSVVSER